MTIELFAHLLALEQRPFTRWFELTMKEQADHMQRAERLIAYGAEYDPVIRKAKEALDNCQLSEYT